MAKESPLEELRKAMEARAQVVAAAKQKLHQTQQQEQALRDASE